MANRKYINKIFVCLIAWFLLVPSAYAYLDPGSGSFLMQVLIAALLAVPLTVKGLWKNLIARIRRRKKTNPKEEK